MSEPSRTLSGDRADPALHQRLVADGGARDGRSGAGVIVRLDLRPIIVLQNGYRRLAIGGGGPST